MKIVSAFLLLLCLSTTLVQAQPVPISGTVNAYRPVTDMGCNWVDVTIASAFSPGDRALLIQMKGADLDQSNTPNFGTVLDYQSAGHFEFVTVDSVSGGRVYFTHLIANTYEVPGVVQLVRVATYTDARVTGPLTVPIWAGISGGVLVLEVSDSLILDADISVSGMGFEGKYASLNPDGSCGGPFLDYFYAVTSGFGAEKGEGIALRVLGKDGGRGAWGNGGGGGNKHNSGGGGGGNFSAGGKGGIEASFCAGDSIGGEGGRSLDYSTGRIFHGGGGGSSDHNNDAGTSGGNGGGIIIIRCGTLTGNGRLISADGADVAVYPNGIGDGAGGGGAGGTILLDVGNYDGSVNVRANGGKGGDQETTWPACFGTGGGGGTGVLLLTGGTMPASISLTTAPGAAGVDINPSSSCYNTTYGARPGDNSSGYLLNFPITEGTVEPVVADLPADTTLCADNSLVLTVPSSPSVTWSTGDTTTSITVDTAGTYWVTLGNGGCISSDTIRITVGNGLLFSIGNDTVICELGVAELRPDMTGDSYLWSTGDTTDHITVQEAGTYWLEITQDDCPGRDSVIITVIPDSIAAFVPNVFSPNGDGNNDKFCITLDIDFDVYDLHLYDRNGQLVFASTDPLLCWDGKLNGVETPAGVYYITLTCSSVCDPGSLSSMAATVTLLR